MKQTTRGRPKGRSSDSRSFGPLGDLLRKKRMEKGLGLADVANSCGCSVQFISNIEHGRAPLPWEKLPSVASFLKIPLEDLQAANLAVRSDFQSFAKTSKSRPSMAVSAASAFTVASKDRDLQELLQAYQVASIAKRKKFFSNAMKLLAE